MCPLHASLSYCASVQAPFYLQDVNLRLKVFPHLQIHPLKQLPGTLSSSEPDHVVPSKHVLFFWKPCLFCIQSPSLYLALLQISI